MSLQADDGDNETTPAPSGDRLKLAVEDEAPAPPVEFGDIVGGKYRVIEIIAHGGMGIICEGEHLELEQRVAIKFIRPDLMTDPDLVARFIGEARAAAALRSPHVVRVMDVGQLPSGVPYLVMEHLEGVDLHTLLEREGQLSVPRAVDYVLQACAALSEAHSAGIVHRDIKPENLFLSSTLGGRPVIKVLDFGIAKRLTNPSQKALTRPGDSVGSPWYMSPEQMRAPHEVDFRSDIWAAGVVLYQLLTLERPFDGRSVPEVCAKVLTAQPAPPSRYRPDLDPVLEAIILRCLEKDREARFSNVDELARTLEPFRRADSGRHVAYGQAPARVASDIEEIEEVDAIPSSGESGEWRAPTVPIAGRVPVGVPFTPPDDSPPLDSSPLDSSPAPIESTPPVAGPIEDSQSIPIPGLRSMRGPVIAFCAAVALGVGLGFSSWSGADPIGKFTAGWLVPAELDTTAPVVPEPDSGTRTKLAWAPLGTAGDRTDDGASLVAERELEIIDIMDLLDPESNAAHRRMSVQAKKRAYRAYLRRNGLKPIGEALAEARSKAASSDERFSRPPNPLDDAAGLTEPGAGKPPALRGPTPR